MTATGATPPAANRGLSRWGRALLIGSLALNFLIVGFAASAMWRHRQDAIFAGNAINANLIGYTQTLPADRRQALWRQTANERRALRPLRAEVRAARQAARTTFLAEPFDAAEFARAQDRVLDAEMRARKEAHRLFLAVANALTKEERAAFASWRPEGGPGQRHRRWWKREPIERESQSPGPGGTGTIPSSQTSVPQ